MSFNTALTSGQYDSLRGTITASPSHRARLCLSLCPNTNVYTARVNQASFGTSFAQLTYDGGSGTLADVLVGMTVLISHTNSRAAAFFTGRIRKTPTTNILYINETSAPVADNDYIFILDDFRVWDKLPRYLSKTEYPDYDVTFRQLLPRIYGLKSGYADMAVANVLELSFAPSVAAATDGATISAYFWNVGDGTITAGSSSTKDITVEFPPGHRWIHFSATDSGGRTSTRHIPVWAHDDTFPVTLLDHGDLEVAATIEDGYSGSVTAFDNIDTVLDNTLICAWLDNERYNGTATHIVDNIALIGRLRREDSTTDYAEGQQDAQTRFDIEGPLQQLARLEITSQQIDNVTSPDAWVEIKTLTVWREIHWVLTELTTFHELHSLDFDDTSSTFREKAIGIQSGDLLSAVNALANGINAAIQMNAAGEAEVVQDAVMIPTASRGALVTVAGWDIQDMLSLEMAHGHALTVGRVDASGGTFDATSNQVTPAQSVAPGAAQDYPAGQQRLDNQILAANQSLAAAESELNIRSGHALAKAQERDELTINHPDGYWWLTPSLNQWYTWTLSGAETARGIVLDTSTRWQLVSTTVTHEVETGARTVEAVYRRESSGSDGDAVRYPPQSNTPITLPDFPALPSFPAFDIGAFYLPDDLTTTTPPATLAGSMSAQILHDGNTVLVWTSSRVFVCVDFIKKLTPTWIEVTPELDAGETIVAARFIPGSPVSAIILTNLTTDAEIVHDFAIDDYGWVPVPGTGTGSVYVPGSGWASVPATGGSAPSENYIGLHISGLKSATIVYDIDNQLHNLGVELAVFSVDFPVPARTGQLESHESSVATGTYTGLTYTAAFTATGGHSMWIGQNNMDSSIWRKITLTLEGGARIWRTTNVFDPAAAWTPGSPVPFHCQILRIGATFNDIYIVDQLQNEAYYSSDRGASFGEAITLGMAPASDGGFDTGRLGTVTIGAADGLARIATTQGGAYSDYATLPTDNVATAIFIPRYSFLGANNGIGVSSPDFLFASVTPASGTGNTLWAVTVGGTVFGNISPSDGGTKGIAVGPNCLNIPWYSAAYQDILAILSFSGTKKLAVSSNGGSAWVLSGALSADANHITTRRSDTQRRQAFLTNGSNLGYCSNYRTNPLLLASRIGPDGGTLLGIDVLP